MQDNNTENQPSKETKPPINREMLGELYPTAKTYDELQARTKHAELRQLERQPKHVGLSVSVNLSVLVVVIVVSAYYLQKLISVNVITGVSAIFLAILAAVGFTVWQASRIAGFLAQKGYGPIPFFAAYFSSVVPLLGASYQLMVETLPVFVAYILLGTINMALVYLVIAIVVSKKLGDIAKILTLTCIVATCIGFAFIVVAL